MIYKVALIEYGVIRHVWNYTCLDCAIKQLDRLLVAYEEVNEVCPVLLKVGQCQENVNFLDLLKNYAFQ